MAHPNIGLQDGDPPMLVQYVKPCVQKKTPSCLKVVDIILPQGTPPEKRWGMMQGIGHRWAHVCHNLDPLSLQCRRGVMWYGTASHHTYQEILDLIKQLDHKVECVVLLTHDPHLQVHLSLPNIQQEVSRLHRLSQRRYMDPLLHCTLNLRSRSICG